MIITPKPEFNSRLTDLLFELEGLRNKRVGGTTHALIFFQLKDLFHIVEALASARIEGNHTTLAAYIEKQVDNTDQDSEKILEIKNLIDGLEFVDEHIKDTEIDSAFIFELHKIIVKGLSTGKGGEGDRRPGAYRDIPVTISQSKHIPPQPSDVLDLMNDLYAYINSDNEPKLDLLKVAIAHHRFVWIHPFANGNGRAVRLLTYAMLCRKGFITTGSTRLFNPTSIFAGDREKYYKMLSKADTESDSGILAWSEYVLDGLKVEIEKSQKLTDESFVREMILLPTIDWALDKNIVSELEAKVLRKIAHKNIIKASDIREYWPTDLSHVVVSKFLKKMKDQNFIDTLKPNGREYIMRFTENKFTRGILDQMEKQNMLPIRVDEVAETS